MHQAWALHRMILEQRDKEKIKVNEHRAKLKQHDAKLDAAQEALGKDGDADTKSDGVVHQDARDEGERPSRVP
jgi:hypothetical protein